MKIILFLVALSCINCSSTGAGTTTTASSTTTSDTVSDLEAVSAGFTPASLENGNETGSISVKQGGSDPCATADDLYDCQPILLRVYLDLARTFIDLTKTVIEEVGEGIGDLPDGSIGAVVVEGQTINYSKTSDSLYSILIEENEQPAAFFEVNGSASTLKLDLDNLSDAGGQEGQVDVALTYTDAENWSVVIFVAGMECDASDPRAPERIHVRVARSGGVWTGKAMFYNGRWLADDDISCSTTETDALSMNFYTDFVGNDTAARASVYMLSRSKSDLSDIEDFSMARFAENFGSLDDTTAYSNPFCNPAETLEAVWDDDCSSLDATLSATAYGSADDWIVPSEFYQTTITLPTSLE